MIGAIDVVMAVIDTDKTVLDLIQYLHDKENLEKQDISVFTLDTATKQQFKDARKLLEMYRSAISGARFDNVDIDNSTILDKSFDRTDMLELILFIDNSTDVINY